MNRYKILFNLLIGVLLYGCITPSTTYVQHSKNLKVESIDETQVQQLAPNNTFFSGDELYAVNCIAVVNTGVDSLEYSLYKDTAGKFFVFALEKLIRWDDVEKYQIIDTIMIRDAVDSSTIVLKEQRMNDTQVLNLNVNQKPRKTWRFAIPPLPTDFERKWKGNYKYVLDYGEKSLSYATVSYVISINKDSCIYRGIGYKTYFENLCRVKFDIDTAFLYFIKSINGDESQYSIESKEMARIVIKNNRYFVRASLLENAEEVEFKKE